MGYVILAVIVSSMIWTAVDAHGRDWSQKKHGSKTAAGQVIGVVLLWPVFFPVYLVQRRSVPPKVP